MSPTLPSCRCGFAAGTRRPLSMQARHVAAPARARTPFCVQAKISKAADFRDLSQEQISEEVQKLKRELFDLRVKQKTRQVSDCTPGVPGAAWRCVPPLLLTRCNSSPPCRNSSLATSQPPS